MGASFTWGFDSTLVNTNYFCANEPNNNFDQLTVCAGNQGNGVGCGQQIPILDENALLLHNITTTACLNDVNGTTVRSRVICQYSK